MSIFPNPPDEVIVESEGKCLQSIKIWPKEATGRGCVSSSALRPDYALTGDDYHFKIDGKTPAAMQSIHLDFSVGSMVLVTATFYVKDVDIKVRADA